MSGRPSTDGVAATIGLIGKATTLKDEIVVLRNTLSTAQKRLDEAEREYAAMSKAILVQLGEMDVDSNGNYGWSGRLLWFLMEFHKQSMASRDLGEIGGEKGANERETIDR